MFAAMMDGIKEESVGFLFNLDVQIDDDGCDCLVGAGRRRRANRAGARPPCRERCLRRTAPRSNGASSNGSSSNGASANGSASNGSGPTLDPDLLAAAQEQHAATSPQIKAKGLEREPPSRPMVYSSPTLDSDTPEVRIAPAESADDDAQGGDAPLQPQPGQPRQPADRESTSQALSPDRLREQRFSRSAAERSASCRPAPRGGRRPRDSAVRPGRRRPVRRRRRRARRRVRTGPGIRPRARRSPVMGSFEVAGQSPPCTPGLSKGASCCSGRRPARASKTAIEHPPAPDRRIGQVVAQRWTAAPARAGLRAPGEASPQRAARDRRDRRVADDGPRRRRAVPAAGPDAP